MLIMIVNDNELRSLKYGESFDINVPFGLSDNVISGIRPIYDHGKIQKNFVIVMNTIEIIVNAILRNIEKNTPKRLTNKKLRGISGNDTKNTRNRVTKTKNKLTELPPTKRLPIIATNNMIIV